MRRINALFFLLLGVVSAPAQQRPQYTQYVLNNYILNPAISGIENYIDVKASYRNQWVGIDDAPVTASLSFHSALGKKFLRSNANSFDEKGTNPMSRSYLQSYKAAEPHHGAGFHVVTDRTGPISRTDFNATYAYHIGIYDKLNIAVGFAAGISRLSLDISKLTLEDANDPAVNANADSKLHPDLSLGVWIYSARYFGGFSIQQVLGSPIAFTDQPSANQGKQVPHYFFTAGYKAFLSEDIAVIPSVMVKQVSPIPVSVDANVKLAFRDKFWLGGSYRKDDSFSAMAGFHVSYLFNLSYSYDFTTSDLNNVSNGTHEIVLGVLLNNRYKATCPQRNW